MAAERLNMRKIREVLRLRLFCGIRSVRDIARGAHCGKTTVSEYLAMAVATGITTWSQVENCSDEELEQRFFPSDRGESKGRRLAELQETLPEWTKVHEELRKPHLTLMLIWTEYRLAHPNGYSYTQFAEHYRRWKGKLALVMRQVHQPGKKGFVDYCDGLELTDSETGETTRTQLFVGVLGASNYTFAMAFLSQSEPDWILANRKFFEFIRGVPEILVPDNLRSGVKQACKYDPVINPAYQELANHYGTCILPARVRKPRDKAKAENGVLQVQRWILAVLRKRVFMSLSEMNAAILECLHRLNSKVMRGYGQSRWDLFQATDYPALKPLPEEPYEWAEWKQVRLGIDYHVRFDDHYYSAPYKLAKEILWVRATSQTIAIHFKQERVAIHPRSCKKWGKSTLAEHMPSHHRAYAEWTPERILKWAKTVGSSTAAFIEAMIASKDHPEQAFKSALGVIGLAKKYGSERAEKACQKALAMKSPRYHVLKTMLKNHMENTELSSISKELRAKLDPAAIEENLRGNHYYY